MVARHIGIDSKSEVSRNKHLIEMLVTVLFLGSPKDFVGVELYVTKVAGSVAMRAPLQSLLLPTLFLRCRQPRIVLDRVCHFFLLSGCQIALIRKY